MTEPDRSLYNRLGGYDVIADMPSAAGLFGDTQRGVNVLDHLVDPVLVAPEV